jgi:hypothetical protein
MDRSLALRIALFNLIGYCSGMLTAIILDPRLSSHVVFGVRYYPYAWLWLGLSPLVFLTSYLFLSRVGLSRGRVLVGSFTPVAVFGCSAAFGFPPECPHMGIFQSAFIYSLLSLLTAWLHQAFGDFSYVTDNAVPYEGRMERLKATVSTWQMALVYGATGYLAYVIFQISVSWAVSEKIVHSPKEIFLLAEAGSVQLALLSVCVVIGPLYECGNHAFKAIEQLSRITKG